ncbi:MAG: MSMEG_0567/Sll0786 family nitrogen starvation N-acetyltransferase [Elainellaceae cyanobacterium]
MSQSRYEFELARSPQQIRAYYALRQQIFCHEQRLFEENDRDDIDRIAYPIVAVDYDERSPQIVGVVRIYEKTPRLWYGGRLGVHLDYRRAGRIGKGLIYKAVTTANTWGCDRFLATVQPQNVRFFQRLHWNSLGEIIVCDRIHHLMEADLDHYPPGRDVKPVLSDVNVIKEAQSVS